MKVFLHYEGVPEAKFSIKVKLPKSWRTGPCSKLLDTVVAQFNKKHPEHAIDGAEFHVELAGAVELASDDVVSERVKDRADVFLVAGPSRLKAELQPSQKSPEEADAGAEKKVTCRRFGCVCKTFLPSQNHATACRFHVKPPVFHETAKWWSCCPDKKAYDWETFMAIPGCSVGPHSTEDQTGKTVLGGTDMRAQQQASAGDASAPQRLNSAADAKHATVGGGRILTPLDKLSNLRKALISIGVDGGQFDSARDSVKEIYEEEEGVEVWARVCTELAKYFTRTLEAAEMQKSVE